MAANFNKKTLGWLFVGLLAFFGLLFAYLLIIVVGPMMQPTAFFEAVTESYKERMKTVERQGRGTDPSRVREEDQVTADLAVMLEYANADIRTAGAQVAFALVGGLLLVAVGVMLLVTGLSGAMSAAAENEKVNVKIAVGPGMAALLLGGAIIFMGVFKDVGRSFRANVERPTAIRLDTEKKDVPRPKTTDKPTPGT